MKSIQNTSHSLVFRCKCKLHLSDQLLNKDSTNELFPVKVRSVPVATTLLCILSNLFDYDLSCFVYLHYLPDDEQKTDSLIKTSFCELPFYPKLKRILFFLVHKHRLRWHLEAAECRHRTEERRDGHRAQEHEGESGVQGCRPSAGRPDAVAADLVCSCGVLWVFCSRNMLHLHLMLLSDMRWGQQDVTFNREGAAGKGFSVCKSEYCLAKSRDHNQWGFSLTAERILHRPMLSYMFS